MIAVEPHHLYYLNPGTDVCLVSGEKQYTRRQLLAEALRVPVVPVVIQGAYDVLPRGKHFPRFFRKISVTILPACMPEEGLTVKEITEKTEELFRTELEKNNP